MQTIEQSVRHSYIWAKNRIDDLANNKDENYAKSIHQEFEEWMNPNIKTHDILSINYLGK